MATNASQMHAAVSTYLNDGETIDFVKALHEYQRTRDVSAFVVSLKVTLSTPYKRQLIPLIRDVIPGADLDEFDYFTKSERRYGTLPRQNVFSRAVPKHGKSVSLPTSKHGTARSRVSRQRPELNGSSRRSSFLSYAEQMKANEVMKFHIDPGPSDDGFGFSIRGGAEYGIGVYISYVDPGGVADKKGLQPGDLLTLVNDINFQKITHDEAVKIIKSARKLELVVCRVGRIPGSYVVHQSYRWVNPTGQTVSPPLELEEIGQSEHKRNGAKSGLMLLKGADERKVNITIEESETLGLMIRGGREFGLGIYISGVDSMSVAENSGLKVGDQILNANGEGFLDITHAEAVKILKTSKHMMLTIKDVGKLPYAKMTVDKTQWLSKEQMSRGSSTSSRLSKSGSSTGSQGVGFSRGAGSQLMLNSMARRQCDTIENQARDLLNAREQETLNYYIGEYQRSFILIDGLVMALFELLNTFAKFSLMTDIRSIVNPRDLDRYDVLVLRKELQALKVRYSQSLQEDIRSAGSIEYEDKMQQHVSRFNVSDRDLDPLRNAIHQIGGHDGSADSISEEFAHSSYSSNQHLRNYIPAEFKPMHQRGHQNSPRPVIIVDDVSTNIDGVLPGDSPWHDDHLLLPSNSSHYNSGYEERQHHDNHSPITVIGDADGYSRFMASLHRSNKQFEEKTQYNQFILRQRKNQENDRFSGSMKRSTSTPNLYQENIITQDYAVSENPQRDSSNDNHGLNRNLSNNPHTLSDMPHSQSETLRPAAYISRDQRSISDMSDSHQSQFHISDEESLSEIAQSSRGRNFNDRENSRHARSRSHGRLVLSNRSQAESDQQRQQVFERKSRLPRQTGSKDVYAQQTTTNKQQFIDESVKDRKQDLLSVSSKTSETKANRRPTSNVYEGRMASKQRDGSVQSSSSPSVSQRSSRSVKYEEPSKKQDHETGSRNASGYYKKNRYLQQHRKQKNESVPRLFTQNSSHENFKAVDFVKDDTKTAKQNMYQSRNGLKNAKMAYLGETSFQGHKEVVIADVHQETNLNRGKMEDHANLNSDDSGVDLNGSRGYRITDERVTISSDKPVVIDTVLASRDMTDSLHYDYHNAQYKIKGNTCSSGILYQPENWWKHWVKTRTMDGCLTLKMFEIPRPKIYSDEEATMINIVEEEDKAQRALTRARKTYGNISVEFLTIYKTKPTLGMAIEGGANTKQSLPRVINIQPGGSAFESGGLKIGHIILEVNNRSLVGLEHNAAARLIAEAFKSVNTTQMELLITDSAVTLEELQPSSKS